MFSTRRLPEDDGDGVLPTDLAAPWSPPEETPWGVSSGLLVFATSRTTVYSSAELIRMSESCSLGIAGRPDELALPKVAVLFEDILATEKVW
jgi:hypothetical protein